MTRFIPFPFLLLTDVTYFSLRDKSVSDRMQKNNVKVVHLDEKSWSKRDPSALRRFVCSEITGRKISAPYYCVVDLNAVLSTYGLETAR